MNKTLKKEVMTRSKLNNKHLKNNSEDNKKAYKSNRNYCVKLFESARNYEQLNFKLIIIIINRKFWCTVNHLLVISQKKSKHHFINRKRQIF